MSNVLQLHPPEPIHAGPYSVIYADPPWSYRDKQVAGERGAGFKYDTMSIEAICRLGVVSLAAQHCALFMWATMPLLAEGLRVMEAWGFTYKTAAFVWVKTNSKAGTPFWGMGSWSRANAELVLLGVRGKPQRVSAGVHQIVHAPREAHSKKPDEVRQRIVQLMGDVPRVELFARESPEGWDVWGNEVECDIELGGVS